jgi:hypothetical protein
MTEARHVKILQDELDRKDRELFEMRVAFIESRLETLEDHEARLRLLEQKATETRTILSLAFGTGLLSLVNVITLWLK